MLESTCESCIAAIAGSNKILFKPVKGSYANSADPDQTPHNVASDQGLHCLLTDFPSKTEKSDTIDPTSLK